MVEAEQSIPDFSIITEYAGEVDRCGRRETDDSDSLMGLLFTDHPSKDLLICPTRYANFARFISGINNSCRWVGGGSEHDVTPRNGDVTPCIGDVTPRNGDVTPRNGDVTCREFWGCET